MEILDLKKIIEHYGLDKEDLAYHLYPEHNHPMRAMYRVMGGEAELNALQVSKLSVYIGCSVAELFKEDWQLEDATAYKSVWTMTSGAFRAVFNTRSFQLSVSLNGSTVHKQVLLCQSISLKKLTRIVNKIVESKSETENKN